MSRIAESLAPQEFGGSTFDRRRDLARLKSQQERVTKLMLDGRKRTLQEIAYEANIPMQSVGSRVRDLKKQHFGGYDLRKEYVRDGIWRYWVQK